MKRLLILLPFLFLLSCTELIGVDEITQEDSTESEKTSRGATNVRTVVFGYMYNATWSRMTGATIKAYVDGKVVATTTSNANGYYSLTVPHGGTMVISGSKAGYKTLTLSHKCGNVDTYRYNMHLRTDGYHKNIRTRAYGKLNNTPIAGIQMALLDLNGKVLTTGVTNSKGEYSLTATHDGTFVITTHDPRYLTYHNAHSFETTSLRFDITPKKAPLTPLVAHKKNDNSYQGLMWYTQSKKTHNSMYGGTYEETEFDINKPTIVFVHGWTDPRDQYYHGSFKYADEYLARGYNVGFYRWNERSNEQYGGLGAGASPHNVGSLVHGVNKDGGTADHFRNELKSALLNGVSIKRKRVSIKGKSTITELSRTALSSYNKEIRLVGHSTGGQIIAQCGNDDFLMSKQVMLVLLDPYFPNSNAQDYRLADFAEGIKKAYEYKRPVYWVASSFIGCEGYRRVRDADTKLHRYMVRTYVRTDAPNFGSRIRTAPKCANRKEQLETAYIYTDASQPFDSEDAHNYAVDWYCETFEHNKRPRCWYWDRNRKIQYCGFKSGSGATGYSTLVRDRGYCYQQLILQPYKINVDGGQYTWSISDDKFIEMNSAKFHPWNPNSNAILAQKF